MSRMPLNGVDDENEAPSFPAVQNTYVMNRNFPNIPQPNSNPRLMFAPQPTSPFYQYFPYPPPQPPQPPQPRFPAPVADNSSCSSPSSNDSGVPNCSAASTANVVNSQNGAKTSTKWGEAQTSVLVNEWKERIDDVESARATETWHRIVQEVNKVGTQKTTKQCKDKIRNLKKSYKEAKANNNKTGRLRQTSPYYDSFDEVLGTRAVVTMPGVIQCGQAESDDMSQDLSGTIESESDEESDSEMNGSEGSESSPNAAVEKQPKRKKRGEADQNKNAKKGRITTASAMIDLTEKLVDMQNAQFKMLETAQKRTEDLLIKLEADQRKLDEESRRRDQEFFLRMAELLKK